MLRTVLDHPLLLIGAGLMAGGVVAAAVVRPDPRKLWASAPRALDAIRQAQTLLPSAGTLQGLLPSAGTLTRWTGQADDVRHRWQGEVNSLADAFIAQADRLRALAAAAARR